jgi:glucose/arabinose dehydrogenase
VVNERDELGDNTPLEYAAAVKDNAFYGWPWYYIGSNEDPRHKGARPDLKAMVTIPDVLMQAHSAPLSDRLLRGQRLSCRLQWNRLRDDARVLESCATDRLQGRASVV